MIGSIFPFLFAILTEDSSSVAIGVIVVCVVVQFLDNNFITPKIVGSSVSINPLSTLIAIILGGMLWGIAGMMLFIPLLGMLKVILDSFESSRPYGFLIGEEDDLRPLAKFSRRKDRVVAEELKTEK
jgi:predicted PurR-regulated permease PerM